MHSVKYTSEYCASHAMKHAAIILIRSFSLEPLGWTLIMAINTCFYSARTFLQMGMTMYIYYTIIEKLDYRTVRLSQVCQYHR